MAVYSFDFAVAQQDAIRTRPRIHQMERVFPDGLVVAASHGFAIDGNHLPAGDTEPPSTQRIKLRWNSSASIIPNTSPNVSCEGIPYFNSKNSRSHSSLLFPNVSTSTQLSAPATTAQIAITEISISG